MAVTLRSVEGAATASGDTLDYGTGEPLTGGAVPSPSNTEFRSVLRREGEQSTRIADDEDLYNRQLRIELDNLLSPNYFDIRYKTESGDVYGFRETLNNWDYIYLVPQATPPTYQYGNLYLDGDKGALGFQTEFEDVTLNIGEEEYVRIVNKTGSTITNGQVVYIDGAQGNRPTASLAQANDLTKLSVIGVATHDILNNEEGYVTTFGSVRELDTSAYTNGQELYLSPTVAGGFTGTKPTGDDYCVVVGYVTTVHATQGEILVKTKTSSLLSDIYDVSHTGAVADGSFLYRNGDYFNYIDFADQARLDTIEWLGDLTHDPTGFVDSSETGVQVVGDGTTRKVSIYHPSGTIEYLQNGKLFTLSGSQASPYLIDVAHGTDTSLDYFLEKIDDSFVWSTTPFNYRNVMIAFAKYIDGAWRYFTEAHGLQPWTSHQEDHDVNGTYWKNRQVPTLTSGTFAIQPATPTDADNTFGVDSGILKDEDDLVLVDAWIQGTYNHAYLTPTGLEIQTGQTNPARVTGTYLNWYNSSGVAVEGATNKYYNLYVYSLKMAEDADSQELRSLVFQPQAEYDSPEEALAENALELNKAQLDQSFQEFGVLAKVTLRTSASYGTTGKYRIHAVTPIDTTKEGGSGSASTGTTAHNLLTGRDTFPTHPALSVELTPYGNIASTNVQAGIQELDDEKVPNTRTVSAGAGLTGGGDLSANRTISHDDTSSVANLDTSGAQVIDTLTFDGFGHVTARTTRNLTAGDIGALTQAGGDARYLQLNGGTMSLGEGLQFTDDENYFGTNADARIIRLIDVNGTGGSVDGGLVFNFYTTTDDVEIEGLRIRNNEFRWKGDNIATQPWVTSQGYLTSESDTLDSVTDRGATTTNSVQVGSIGAGGVPVAGYAGYFYDDVYTTNGFESGGRSEFGLSGITGAPLRTWGTSSNVNFMEYYNNATRIGYTGFVGIGDDFYFTNETATGGFRFNDNVGFGGAPVSGYAGYFYGDVRTTGDLRVDGEIITSTENIPVANFAPHNFSSVTGFTPKSILSPDGTVTLSGAVAGSFSSEYSGAIRRYIARISVAHRPSKNHNYISIGTTGSTTTYKAEGGTGSPGTMFLEVSSDGFIYFSPNSTLSNVGLDNITYNIGVT